jgi:asparagine synthase (glutamine-hydrolysing)
MSYVFALWRAETPPIITQAIQAGGLGPTLPLAAQGPTWAAFSPVEEILVLPSGRGVVFGRLFTRAARPERVRTAAGLGDPSDVLEKLSRSYWGRYLAVLVDPAGGMVAARDPSGNLPAFRIRREPMDLLFSDVGQAAALGLVSPRIDWSYLARHIAFGGARSAATGLVGVAEILPGDALAAPAKGAMSTRPFWRPNRVIEAAPRLEASAWAERLLAEIEGSVAALAAAEGPIIVELSGGLDSSIVALALRERVAAFAVNVTTIGPEGDERRYARQVARAAGLPLTELVLDAGDIDFSAPPLARLARPGRPTVLQSVDAAFQQQGRQHRASAFFNGAGGDSVLGYFISAAPVVDRFRAQGLSPGVMTTIMDVASLTGANAWTVARLALKIGLRRQDPPRSPDLEHLAPAWRQVASPHHPWQDGLAALPPGKRRHVQAVLGVHAHMDGHDRSVAATVVSPHMAQPVLELALAIPTWLSVAGGRDRAIARRAFAALLPPDVLNRRSKGRINSFVAAAYEANRDRIGPMLAEGLLAREGLLDLDGVAATLRKPVEMTQARFMSILRLVDAELWARSWSR